MNNNIGPNIQAFHATGNKLLGKQEAREDKLANAGTKASDKSGKNDSGFTSQNIHSDSIKNQLLQPQPKGLNSIIPGLGDSVVALVNTDHARDIIANISNMSLADASKELNPSTIAGLNAIG